MTEDHTHTVEPGDSLWLLAAAHLGSPDRAEMIVEHNWGRLQADGGRLEDFVIRPGWTVRLPAAAPGEEVL